MKRIYQKPSIRTIDLSTEGMIAESVGVYDEVYNEQLSNKKEESQNLWGRNGIWK